MNVTHVSIASVSMQTVQSVHGHRHHQSLGDMVSKMKSSIDDAVNSGMLDRDLADELKKRLEEIRKELSQSQNGADRGLSSDDRQKIRKELKEIGKQFFAALQARNSAPRTSDSSFDSLFRALDANGDGKIDKNELSAFMGNMSGNVQGTGNALAGSRMYSPQGSTYVSVSLMQASFSVTA